MKLTLTIDRGGDLPPATRSFGTPYDCLIAVARLLTPGQIGRLRLTDLYAVQRESHGLPETTGEVGSRAVKSV